MPAPFPLTAYRDDLKRIVQSVFRAMMDLEVEAAGDAWPRAPDCVTSAVEFVGGWRGAVLLECCAGPACRFAGLFMGIPAPAAVDGDVRDVMGELANMVAGNLKSVLPRGVDLSMPLVVLGNDYTLQFCGGKLVERAAFASPAGGFGVTLVELFPASS